MGIAQSATVGSRRLPFCSIHILPRYPIILYAASGWYVRSSGAAIDSCGTNEPCSGVYSSCLTVVARLIMTFANLRMSGGSWRIPRIETPRVSYGRRFLCLLFLCGAIGHPEPGLDATSSAWRLGCPLGRWGFRAESSPVGSDCLGEPSVRGDEWSAQSLRAGTGRTQTNASSARWAG